MNWYLQVWKNYATFNGRARRKEYWMFVLFSLIVSLGFIALMGTSFYEVMVSGNADSLSGPSLLWYYSYNFYSLAVFIPSLAVLVRRLHDVNKSGWFMLISLLPIIGGIWLLVVLCQNGNEGINQYGQDPKGDDENLLNEFGRVV